MTLFKTMRLGELCGLLPVCLSTITVQAADGIHLLGKGIDLSLEYAYLGVTVKDMPYEIRNVPVHPSDSWASYGQGPIERLKYDMDHSFIVSILYAREYGRDKTAPLRFRFGAGFDWLVLPQVGVGGSMAERNYMNAVGTSDRGYGAALTYVAMRQGGVVPALNSIYSDIFLNWTPKVKFEVAPFGGHFHDIWLGTSVSYYTVDAQTGWDRNDSLDARNDYVMARVLPVRLYATWMFKSTDGDDLRVGLTGGVQFQPGVKTGIARQAGASIDPMTFFAGVTYRW
jgi:hypothetical protein